MLEPKEYTLLSTLLSEPHRKYHNINHIHQCLAELENFDDPCLDYRHRSMIEAAIWYHDAIYNPYSKQNEHNSAMLAGRMKQPELVIDMIKLTARHLEGLIPVINDYSPPAQLAIKVMLDIDLAGFGKDRMVFALNGMNIRHEYYQTKLVDFLVGRLKFYQALVKRPTLYYTKQFHTLYHEKSRENIEWEMSLLTHAVEYQNPKIWSNAMESVIDSY